MSLAVACSLDAAGAVGLSDAGPDVTMARDTGSDTPVDVRMDVSDVAALDRAMPDACTRADRMSDPKNCGACDHDCLGGACVAGACQPKVLATTMMPQAIAVQTTASSATLYWTDIAAAGSGQGVYSCSLPDCTTPTPSGGVSGCNHSLGLAVDATNYYFTCWTNSWFYICSNPASCSKTFPILTTTAMGGGVDNPSGITVDTSGVEPGIFLLAQSTGGTMHSGAVVYEPFDGGTSTNFQGAQNYPSGIATVGAELFWTESADNGVSSCTLSGSPPGCGGSYAQILPGPHSTLMLPSTDQIAADAANIYFTVNGTMPMFEDGAVYQASHDGATVAPLATSQMYPRGIAIDTEFVYWVRIGGGPVVTLASGLAAPVGITQDSTAIYWTNQGDGTISRLAK
jgi:hypothetical protein